MSKLIVLSKLSGHVSRFYKNTLSLGRNKLLIFILGFALIGSITLIATHAAAPTISVEPESGTISSNAVVVPDTSASGSSAVQFRKATSPPPPTASCPTGWPVVGGSLSPCAGNTGVPAGTVLAAYTGPSTITSCGETAGGVHGIVNGVIDSVQVNGGISIRASNGFHDSAHPCVIIKNSLFIGATGSGTGNALINNGFGGTCSGAPCGPTNIYDTEIHVTDGGTYALYEANWHAWRIKVHGSQSITYCDSYCEVHDSYLYDPGNDNAIEHLGALHDTGTGVGQGIVDHNTMQCSETGPEIHVFPASGGGCNASLALNPQPGTAIIGYTVTNNFFLADPSNNVTYCTNFDPTGGTANIYTGNVWQKGASDKCGTAAAEEHWGSITPGNIFCNNKYDDGTPLPQPTNC